MVFLTSNLRNNILIELLSENILIFLSAYQTVPYVGHSVKKIIDNYNEEETWGQLQSKLIDLV
jgi:hypothetical protein